MRRLAKASSAGSNRHNGSKLLVGAGLVLLLSLLLGTTIASAVVPTVTMGTASSPTATTAQVSGTVDVQDKAGGYFFEYSTDQVNWTFKSSAELPAGSGLQNVSGELTGLEPNTTYFVRLTAGNADGNTTSAPPNPSFKTTRAAPDAQTLYAGAVGAASATLAAKVNPHNSLTTYQFQWGTDTSYGNVVPASPTALGASDNAFHVVTAPIAGLQQGTIYHFRVVATNTETSEVDEGLDRVFTPLGPPEPPPSSCPNAEFRQGPSASLPDCRAYEQVSPVDKAGYDVAGTEPPADFSPFASIATPIAESGDATYFRAKGTFAGSPEGGESISALTYLAHRGADDWSAGPAAPRLTKIGAYQIAATSSDLSRSVLRPTFDAFEPDPLPSEGESTTYLRQNLTGEMTLLFSDVSNEGSAGSADLEHFAFNSPAVLVDDPAVPPFGMKVYEYSAGEIRLVSRQPGSNAPSIDEAALAGVSAGADSAGGGSIAAGSSSAAGAGAISADGSEIFVETPPSTGSPGFDPNTVTIYRRSNGTSTELASPSRRTPVDPQGPKPKLFMRATPDGNSVFFTSRELLTDDANTGPSRKGADLYRYDFAADELIDISATPGGDGARVKGVLGVSDDGDRVYYAALAQLLPDEGVDGGRNVYLWEDDGSPDGITRFVATLADPQGGVFNDALNWATGASFPTTFSASRISDDGRFLLMQAVASLTGYPNSGCVSFGNPAPCTELYRYDADAFGGSGDLACVSCRPSGDPPQGHSFVPVGANGMTPRVMSEDGREVFFSSQDGLLPEDTNGKADVYLWSAGRLSLLSTGKGTGNSGLTGISADGSDAFFVTRDPLVPQDVDNNVDLYTAHVGGGFASQQAVRLPSCEGEACRGTGSAPAPAASALSTSFAGPGNVSRSRSHKCAKGKRKVKGRCVKRHGRGHHKRAAKQTGRASR